ncbi:tetratricopeptide repeat protein [Zhihengliuella salsuginis]|uniref:Tetratricopeptide repeat-containing protein n=1 Tax=Zhihengliuella salsuginis TaxID=578222 RepID=A0ABQ3GKS1_9MICC|nr:tetratricopeptide repeat protein [Zhihengliuella salsuginis]GHD12190.1 hypothetical protein GCM10008096_27370 [Zhihengliuella salsuginis]
MPGINRDPETLLPVIVDEQQADLLVAGDDPCDAVVVLIARGEYREAAELVADVRLTDPQNIRMRMLDTDLQRAMGKTDAAITRLRALLEEFKGSSHEAMMHQYLGILYYTEGDLTAAEHRFELAHRLHSESGAPERRVELARRSLEAVKRREALVR